MPEGYTASKIEGETTVNGGFVIYECNEKDIEWNSIQNENLAEENSNTSSKEKELLQLQSSYNQYVWVPVNEEQINSIYGVDSNGKIWGKLYSYTQDGRSPLGWKDINSKVDVKVSTNYFEPGLGYGANTNIVSEMTLQLRLNKNREELLRELEQNYYEMIKSIKKYGGFYIGRYESGLVDNEVTIRRLNENLSEQSWTDMYQKTKKLKKENENIITSMIWSSLWDYTIQWFIDTGAKTYEDISKSDSWGNYRDSSFEYYTDVEGNISLKEPGINNSKLIPAGSSEYSKANNIYDMAGNVNELTLGCYSYYFSYRGGYYDSSSDSEKSCSYRSYQEIDAKLPRTGSRAILLLK